jgi:GTP cyclohydrolase II
MKSEADIRAKVTIPVLNTGIIGDFFSFNRLCDSPNEHIAIGLGDYQHQSIPLVRLHSECLTGDVFGSKRCDCGEQLKEAIQRITESGGYLLYLRQEGRGIGLYNKLDAYQLQDQGMDTFEANSHLGFQEDARSYASAAEMLTALKVKQIRLLSNNPEKERQLKEAGIQVIERLQTITHQNPHNHRYLITKAEKARHNLNILSANEPEQPPF